MQWEDVENLRQALDSVRERRTRQDMRLILDAVERYSRQTGSYPQASDFVDLIDKLSPDFLGQVIRLDGWHNEYWIEYRGGKLQLVSSGPDGKANTRDDIR
jgi:hypothetical protein